MTRPEPTRAALVVAADRFSDPKFQGLRSPTQDVDDPTGRLFFVTTDTTFDLLQLTGISAMFVGEQMEYSRSKRIVALLDRRPAPAGSVRRDARDR